MKSTTHPKSLQTPTATTTAGGENRQGVHKRHIIEAIVWGIGFLVLIVASVMVHSHPGPWPFDLQTTLSVQHLHLWPWVQACLTFVDAFNDPIPVLIALVIWFIGLSLFRRFQQAIFIAVGTGIADVVDGLLSTIVGRPRPSSPLIHVYIPEPFHSFPSGHTEHCVVYYGFLLYLSFTKPVREWRYHWLLLPLQIFAVLNVLLVGYARVEAGSHWITDALAGYLSGGLLLFLLISLYRWTTDKLARRRAPDGILFPWLGGPEELPKGER
jgi:membrane-associated phospholipid phosphatase